MNLVDTSQISDPNVEQPYLGPSLAWHQAAALESMAQIVQGVNGNPTSGYIVLYGMYNTVVGAVNTLTAGAIYSVATGEIFVVPAAVITLTGSNVVLLNLTVTNGAADPVTFSDGSTKNVHNIRRYNFAQGLTGTGTLDYSTAIFLNEKWNEIGTTGGSNGMTVQPTFTNSWANAGGSDSTMAFKKDRDGFVCLKGNIKTGASNTSAFTLPAAYRPTNRQLLPMATPAATEQTYVYINTDGTVKPEYASGTQFSLDGLRFPLD